MPGSVLKFWFEILTKDDHFRSDDAVDSLIREDFRDLWIIAAGGGKADWQEESKGALALIIVLDQFPRNMFRGSSQAFHSDALAREVARQAMLKGYDLLHEETKRLFFYLPFMHSESIEDQEKSVDFIASRMPKDGEKNLLHARAHRRVIRMFGRFPYRNEALGRANSALESKWLDDGGYGSLVDQIVQEDREK